MDALDERWADFLCYIGYTGIPLPSHLKQAEKILDMPTMEGVIFSGGPFGDNSTSKRDTLETTLLEQIIRRKIPLVGVCRGMQIIASYFGYNVTKVYGHVGKRHIINMKNSIRSVNSFHNYGILDIGLPFQVLAQSPDGIIESIKHSELPMVGIMWHPEREFPYKIEDCLLFQHTFET